MKRAASARYQAALVWRLSTCLIGSLVIATLKAEAAPTDLFAPQAFLICQLIGDSDHARAQVLLSEKTDPIITGNHKAIVSALESLQGGLGRCSHVSPNHNGVARMVFQRGYSIAFSWDSPGQQGASKPAKNDMKNGIIKKQTVPLLRWHHFFAPHLEGLPPQDALKRLQHEHPSSLFSFRAEEWNDNPNMTQTSQEVGEDDAPFRASQDLTDSNAVWELGPQDQQLHIASLFKLSVFNQLIQRIRSQTLWWADRPEETNGRSIEEAAREMIVNSDNAATDQLVALLGLRSVTPSLMLFQLKYSLPEFYRTIYPAALPILKSHIEHFASEEQQGPNAMCRRSQCNEPHVQLGLDWTRSPREVCATLREIDAHADHVANAILAENEPFLEPKRKSSFSFVGFKGGRDVGTLAAAYLVRKEYRRNHPESTLKLGSGSQTKNADEISIKMPNRRACIVVIWNDAQEDVAYGKFSYLTNWFFDAYQTSENHEYAP